MTDTGKTSSPRYSSGYTQYVLGVLVVVFVLKLIYRHILSILAPAIKEDLGLSDTQIGALSGIAFGIFYATFGIPVARLADKYSRVNIISICLGIWSLMTALSGAAGNFMQLLIARIGVGIGEAGGSPPSHSLIADYFPPSKRASALGIYGLGIPIGILIGNFAGGWIGEAFGWRSAFFIVGVPGILLAVVLKMTVKEPPRGHSEGRSEVRSHKIEHVPFIDVLKTMWGFRSFRHIAMASATQAFVGYGVVAWMPSFLVRSHNMTIGEVGMALGLIIGICGGVGTLLGGIFSDRFGRRNIKWYMWLPAIGFLLSVPLSFGVFISERLDVSLALYVFAAFLVSVYTGPTLAMTQNLAPLAMRAAASALLFFIMNMVGLGLGPTFIGIFSDILQQGWQISGSDSLRYALIACNLVYLLSAWHYFRASRTLEADLAVTKD